jgi:superfamily II DNA or RNA helicase
MPRHYASEARVEQVLERLSELFLGLGSVNALAEALSPDGQESGQRVYPNRIHGLLSGDPNRSINTATLETIEHALDGLQTPADTNGSSQERNRIEQAIAATQASTPDLNAALGRVADELEVPLAVVRFVAKASPDAQPSPVPATSPEADWSWQEEAVAKAVGALGKSANYKAGLIVPTGGGKTRVSLRVILRWLAQSDRTDTVALWVTHRTRLQVQARRALQQLLAEPGHVPDGAASLFADRIKFVMLNDVPNAIATYGEKIALVVVDEAHHAAAPSYEPIFTDAVAPGLFLTATPNRMDNLPIGIDEIAYTITYRELFRRGCVIEPVFDPPLELPGLDWSSSAGLRDLADELLERTEHDFKKVLVAVSTRERAETLYSALAEQFDERPHHPLEAADIGFVHGSRASGPGTPNDYIDEFTARPRGILVATSQLLGEGFDDPLIDAAVVTYPSGSIGHLMQVAGRALRVAPGKTAAHIVQVRESSLEYHFEQRWLYQDISDALRPDLVDVTYTAIDDLRAQLDSLLNQHNVASAFRQRIHAEAEALDDTTGEVNLMLTGIPYFDAADAFGESASWGAILVTPQERQRFVHIFNDVSARTEDIKHVEGYLAPFIGPEHRPGSLWKSYVDLVTAMEYARREIDRIPYAGAEERDYHRNRGTTWLKYVTLQFDPAVPEALQAFLADAVNKGGLIASYLHDPAAWASAVRIELPLSGSLAWLLDAEQAEWLRSARVDLAARLSEVAPDRGFEQIAAWRRDLDRAPIPQPLIDEIARFLRAERFAEQHLDLGAARGQPASGVSPDLDV